MNTPYYADASVELWLGDCRDVIPRLGRRFDAVIADPPYGVTSITWDGWPNGWPAAVATVTSSMWCFGSLRMFFDRLAEFGDWQMSHDVVWEKHNGSGFACDRFRRIHEHAVHWYRGAWSEIRHEVPRIPRQGPDRGTRRAARAGAEHLGANNGHDRPWLDDGTRLMSSVLQRRSTHGRAIHPTEKPVDLLVPLIEYAVSPGGTLLVPFAGSGADAVAARLCGRRAVLIESDEVYAEKIATRLAQDVLPVVELDRPDVPEFDQGALL